MKGKFKLNHLIVHLILLVGVIVVVFPFAWMILTSFKTSGEAMKIPPTIFPEKFVTTAYHTIVTSAIPFATVYMNTIITTVVTTLVQIVFCSTPIISRVPSSLIPSTNIISSLSFG